MKQYKKTFCLLLGGLLLSSAMMSAAAPALAAEANPAEIYDYDRDAAYARLAQWQDPNYMSDEEFFGKYENGRWVNAGKLDYERISDLSAVKMAVEQQNYDLAKEEWLRYFRGKRERIPATKPEFTRQDMLSSQLLEYD